MDTLLLSLILSTQTASFEVEIDQEAAVFIGNQQLKNNTIYNTHNTTLPLEIRYVHGEKIRKTFTTIKLQQNKHQKFTINVPHTARVVVI